MIIIKLQGRLGNQLFEYAFAYSVAKRLKTNFLIEYTVAPFVLAKYFDIKDWNVLSPLRNMYIRVAIRNVIRKLLTKKYALFDDHSNPEELKITDETYYNGYFQSVAFFEQMQDVIRHKFTIKKRFVNAFQSKYGELFNKNKILVIHIRRTDYLTAWGNLGIELSGKTDLSLPPSYYKDSLNKIDDLGKYRIIITGDDMEFAKLHFSNLPNVSFEQNDMIIDFQLLMNADAIIMSNSSFAWWATYLNKKNKIVYAPKYFLGFNIKKEFPVGISYGLPYIWQEVRV